MKDFVFAHCSALHASGLLTSTRNPQFPILGHFILPALLKIVAQDINKFERVGNNVLPIAIATQKCCFRTVSLFTPEQELSAARRLERRHGGRE
ncbi:hypothetical protein [Mesorhizobium sp. ArgA1]